jgi:hypothetical protein
MTRKQCISQISGLLQTRSTGDENAAVLASASASLTRSLYNNELNGILANGKKHWATIALMILQRLHLTFLSKPPCNLAYRINKLFQKNRFSDTSVYSDHATTKAAEMESVAGDESIMGMAAGENSVICKKFTVVSLDTVKVSNGKVRPKQQQKHQGPHGDSKKNGQVFEKVIGPSPNQGCLAKDPLTNNELVQLRSALTKFHATPQHVEKLRDSLQLFEGTRCFHSFTNGKTADDKSATRCIITFETHDPIIF